MTTATPQQQQPTIDTLAAEVLQVFERTRAVRGFLRDTEPLWLREMASGLPPAVFDLVSSDLDSRRKESREAGRALDLAVIALTRRLTVP